MIDHFCFICKLLASAALVYKLPRINLLWRNAKWSRFQGTFERNEFSLFSAYRKRLKILILGEKNMERD